MNLFKHSLIVLLSIFFVHLKAIDEHQMNMLKAGGSLLASGGMIYIFDKAGNCRIIQDTASAIGVSPDDVGRVAALSGGLVALSFFGSKENKEAFQKLALRAPIAAAVAGVTFTKTFQEIVRRIPVVGNSITCENEKCKGICNKCKLTKTVLAIGVYRLVDTLIDSKFKAQTNK
jgi:hypothetical protein